MLITLTRKSGLHSTESIDVQTHNIVYMAPEGEGTHIMTLEGSLHVTESPQDIKDKIIELEKAEFNLFLKVFKAMEKA